MNEPFRPSINDYDWLGSGSYFWEANPDRALDWARETASRKDDDGSAGDSVVVGAVIDLGYCLDLMSSNGVSAIERAYARLVDKAREFDVLLPQNAGGPDLVLRRLDRAVVEYLHTMRAEDNEPSFDTVRGLFGEDQPIYAGSGFRRKTHVQICVRNPEMIKGIFRVPAKHFSQG